MIVHWIRSPRFGRLAQASLITTASFGLRALLQAVGLILITRWLSPENYGLFAGTVAAAALCVPLSGWGVSWLVSREVGRRPEDARSTMGAALLRLVVSAIALVPLATLLAEYFSAGSIALPWLLLIATAEIFLLPAANSIGTALLALSAAPRAAIAFCGVPLGRVLVLGGFVLWLADATVANVVLAQFVGTAFGLLTGLALFTAKCGVPSRLPPARAAMWRRDGTAYAIGSLFGLAYLEVDKVLILHLLGPESVGTYSVAFRIAGALLLPIFALNGASLPRLFTAHGTDRYRPLQRSVLLSSVTAGTLLGVAALLAAPLLPWIFGQAYVSSVDSLLMLCPWPLLFALRQAAGSFLAVQGMQSSRVWTEAVGLLIVILGNVLLLPEFGTLGAIISLLVCECVVLALFAVLLTRSHSMALTKSR